jgi:antitoxin (DNA-binding transcriptional repressor) of toxin-antitoxin stability system
MARRVARADLASCIDQLVGSVDGGEGQVEITDHGRVIAVITSPPAPIVQPKSSGLMASIDVIRNVLRGVDPDEFMADITAEVEAVREGCYHAHQSA